MRKVKIKCDNVMRQLIEYNLTKVSNFSVPMYNIVSKLVKSNQVFKVKGECCDNIVIIPYCIKCGSYCRINTRGFMSVGGKFPARLQRVGSTAHREIDSLFVPSG